MKENENSQRSFAEMAGYVKESQLAVLNYVEQKKYVPSTVETEHNEECKMMIHHVIRFFKNGYLLLCAFR